jgi:hypothetical protein
MQLFAPGESDFDEQLFEGDPARMAGGGDPPRAATSLWEDLCDWFERLGSGDAQRSCPGTDEHKRLAHMVDNAVIQNRDLSLQVLEAKVRLRAAERKSAELEVTMATMMSRFDSCLTAMETHRVTDLSARAEFELRLQDEWRRSMTEGEERLVRKLDSNFTKAQACIDKRFRKERQERKERDCEERPSSKAPSSWVKAPQRVPEKRDMQPCASPAQKDACRHTLARFMRAR